MFDVVRKVMAPRSEGAFLSSTELESAFGRLRQASASLEAARVLTDRADSLIEEAVKSADNQFPLPSPSLDSPHAPEQNYKDSLAQGIERYLRMIIYCLVAGGTEPLDQYLTTTIKETSPSSASSPKQYIAALNYIKANHGLKDDAAREADYYIDYAIHRLS
jgi:phycocyanin alpha chain